MKTVYLGILFAIFCGLSGHVAAAPAQDILKPTLQSVAAQVTADAANLSAEGARVFVEEMMRAEAAVSYERANALDVEIANLFQQTNVDIAALENAINRQTSELVRVEFQRNKALLVLAARLSAEDRRRLATVKLGIGDPNGPTDDERCPLTEAQLKEIRLSAARFLARAARLSEVGERMLIEEAQRAPATCPGDELKPFDIEIGRLFGQREVDVVALRAAIVRRAEKAARIDARDGLSSLILAKRLPANDRRRLAAMTLAALAEESNRTQ